MLGAPLPVGRSILMDAMRSQNEIGDGIRYAWRQGNAGLNVGRLIRGRIGGFHRFKDDRSTLG
jgi:hypothetical protein